MSTAVENTVHSPSPEPARLQRPARTLIREKHVPIANLGLFKPGAVVEELKQRLPYRFGLHEHTRAWKHHAVRPPAGDDHPTRTRSEYCVYDETHEDYVYTKAWIEKLATDLVAPAEYERVVGHPPN